MDKDQKKMEMGEIKRLIRLSKEHANYYVEDNDDSYLQPVFQDKNSTDMVIESINTILSFVKKQVAQGITEYKIHSGNMESVELLRIKRQIEKVTLELRNQIIQ